VFALDRLRYHHRRFRRKLGATTSRSVERHLTHAAAIEQVLEVARHQMFCGRQFDPAYIAAVREQMAIALMRATIAADRRPKRSPTQKKELK
jgi:hypothetical protein